MWACNMQAATRKRVEAEAELFQVQKALDDMQVPEFEFNLNDCFKHHAQRWHKGFLIRALAYPLTAEQV